MSTLGAVHVVGAGPGDPGLLTRRGPRLLAEADVVVADGRTSDAVLALASSSAELHRVGTADGAPPWPLADIVDLMVTRVAEGHQVVRLEAGDIFVASPVAEEVAALQARGVAVTTTPGVSTATAAPLATGMVPVPGSTVTFADDSRDHPAAFVDWGSFDEPGSTLVVLSDQARHDDIADRLTAAGIAGTTPVAIVTAPGASVVRTDVAGLRATRSVPPVTLVVGPMRRRARLPG